MDDDNNQPKPKSKTTLFLGCFGFSGKQKVSRKKPEKIVLSDHKHKWFSRSRTFLLKQSGTKTVPVEYSAISEKLQTTLKKSSSKPKRKNSSSDHDILSKRKTPASQDKIPATNPKVDTTSDQASEDSPHKTNHSSEQNIILENGKLLNSPKQLSFRRKIDSSRICSCSQPGSPNPRTHKTHPAIHRLTSSPATNPPEKSRVSAKKKPRNLNGTSDKKFDPVIGMSIVMITLIIMLLWGRLCAILCTSAWLYFIPRLAAKVKPTPNGTVKNGLVSGEPDFNPEEHKKRVVLEGFLERNHRRPPPS
ncbi:hypothetical protein P3X46_007882 [Hevea brasiliensis]|uniref:Transmembrane protein n=1 Tax=Hevea brasiliensis TaxID=3981 RepID=A0ABQ9MWX0_HEVBR|nr:uncharacterized protein At5g23160 [Hevea brasiliensis]KAJ9184110.1 hypothetical protein P3X46_007882 [Hevea brasiliensis]